MKKVLDFSLAHKRGDLTRNNPPSIYIPEGALQIFLDEYTGPMDVLLYLIRGQQLAIEDINIAEIAEQYAEYLKLMKQFNLQLAAEYLVMSAILAEIKSLALLPRTAEDAQDKGEEMRAALVKRLKEYAAIGAAAQRLAELPRLGRDFWTIQVHSRSSRTERRIEVSPHELSSALAAVLTRRKMQKHYELQQEELSTQDRMISMLQRLRKARELNSNEGFISFESFFTQAEGAAGVAVAFISLLQLIKDRLVEVRQNSIFEPLHIRIYAADGAEIAE